MTILLNKRQTEAMLKAKKAIENGEYKCGVSYVENEILRIYRNIIETYDHTGLSTCSDSREFYRKKGFTVSLREGCSGCSYIGILNNEQMRQIEMNDC